MVPLYALVRSDTGAVQIGNQKVCCKGGLARVAAEPYIVQAPQKKVAQLSLGLPHCIVTCTLLMHLVHDLAHAMLMPSLSPWTDQLHMQGNGPSLLIPGTDHSTGQEGSHIQDTPPTARMQQAPQSDCLSTPA